MAARCRICERPLFDRPLARYANMPRVAQFLPDAGNLEADRGLDLVVCQCSGCGLVQLDSEPVHYYKDVIRAAALSPEMRAFREAQFRDFASRFSLSGRKAIEIGCGRGEYLSVLNRTGVMGYGLEHAPDAVAACVAEGLRVTRGFVGAADQALADGPFAAFLILNFLEHLPDPNATLRGIRHNLADDGVGLVEVPNFDAILRERQFAEFMSDHLLYFTAATLTTALTINGFDVLDCSEQFHGYILSAVVRKRLALDLSEFLTQQARQREQVHAYIGRFAPRRVAIWGAGHQALAIMALLDLGSSIRYVVDSAPFKQGKFTPATHIPIVAPERLESDPVDAVIVIAGGYSAEVVRTLRAGFDPGLDVAVWSESGLETV